MPGLTPRLALPIPLANERADQTSIVALAQAVDSVAAQQSQVDEPFFLVSAVYNASTNKIDLTFGPGRAAFLDTLVTRANQTTYSIPSPVPNTAYTVYLKNDGTYMSNTTGAEVAGAVPIWQVSTGNSVSTLAVSDLRGRLGGAAARTVADRLAAHQVAADPHPQYAMDTDLAGYIGKPNTPADGDLLMYQSGAWTRLPKGTAGQFLQGGAVPAWSSVPAKTLRFGHTYTIPGDIVVASGDADYIPPFFVSLAAGQTAKLAKVRFRINSGTSATCKLQINGADAAGYTALTVTTTTSEVDAADITLIDNDMIALVVTAVAGSPKNLSLTVFIDYAA